ncbi:hypothetical protein ACJX0J_032435, partial [Zea mays]
CPMLGLGSTEVKIPTNLAPETGRAILIVTSIIIFVDIDIFFPHNNSHVAWLLLLVFGSTNEILGMLPLAYGLAYISVLTMFFVRRLKFIILSYLWFFPKKYKILFR